MYTLPIIALMVLPRRTLVKNYAWLNETYYRLDETAQLRFNESFQQPQNNPRLNTHFVLTSLVILLKIGQFHNVMCSLYPQLVRN